jgi:hypothetical protein
VALTWVTVRDPDEKRTSLRLGAQPKLQFKILPGKIERKIAGTDRQVRVGMAQSPTQFQTQVSVTLEPQTSW